jgi:hypothetical protein
MRSNLFSLHSSGVWLLVLSPLALEACATSSSHGEPTDGGSKASEGSSIADSAPPTETSTGGDAGGSEGSTQDAAGGNDGAAGTGDGNAGSTDGAPPSSCASLPLCDGFDTDTTGMPPSSELWTLIGTAGCSGSGNPNAPVVYPIVVDDSQHHSAPNSVKVTGGDSCGPLMLNTSAFAKLTGGEVYGRFYVYLSSTSATFDHTALSALGLTSSTFDVGDQSAYLQLASEGAGNPTNVFMWQTTDGNILPDKQTSGGAASAYPEAATWTCVEFHTATDGTLETWVGGTAISGLTFVPGTTQATAGVNNEWKPISPFTPTSFGLGWIVFSGPAMSLWFDDVALGTVRIGCE